MSRINGKTAVYGIIGNPVSHSLSPLIQNSLFELNEINGAYAAFPVLESLDKAVSGAHSLGIKGLNVTVPYKTEIIPFLSEIDESAKRIGAVNTLKYTDNGYIGYNTDIHGVLRTFENYGISFKKQSLLILGAGGGARACAFAGAEHGASTIYIANRTINNSESIATAIKKYYNITVQAIGYNELHSIKENYFIVQATSVGMNESKSPIEDKDIIKSSGGVFDIIYSPLKTNILRSAEELGKLSVNGLSMLVYQAVSAFEIWNGINVGSDFIMEVSERLRKYFIRETEEK